MPATVDIIERASSGGTEDVNWRNKTSGTGRPEAVRFKNANNFTVDANNPLVKPTSGDFDRSYEKYLRLRIGSTGPGGEITNLRAYMDGTFATGLTFWFKAVGTFSTPVEPSADSGYTQATSSAITSSSPLDLDAINTGPFTGTNTEIGDFCVCYMKVANDASAPQNPTASEVLTFSYDET
jgi:hypothetical protein